MPSLVFRSRPDNPVRPCSPHRRLCGSATWWGTGSLRLGAGRATRDPTAPGPCENSNMAVRYRESIVMIPGASWRRTRSRNNPEALHPDVFLWPGSATPRFRITTRDFRLWRRALAVTSFYFGRRPCGWIARLHLGSGTCAAMRLMLTVGLVRHCRLRRCRMCWAPS